MPYTRTHLAGILRFQSLSLERICACVFLCMDTTHSSFHYTSIDIPLSRILSNPSFLIFLYLSYSVPISLSLILYSPICFYPWSALPPFIPSPPSPSDTTYHYYVTPPPGPSPPIHDVTHLS